MGEVPQTQKKDDQDENGGDGGEGREAGRARREGTALSRRRQQQRLQRRPARGASNTRVRFPKDTYFATCHPGLEPALASELRGLPGVLEVTEGRAGVNFTEKKELKRGTAQTWSSEVQSECWSWWRSASLSSTGTGGAAGTRCTTLSARSTGGNTSREAVPSRSRLWCGTTPRSPRLFS